MNWIKNFVRPKISGILGSRRDVPENMWVKCPESGEMVFYRDLEANQFVVPGSGYHMRMGAEARLKSLFDGGAFTALEFPKVASDPLNFRDEKKYSEKIKQARTKTRGQVATPSQPPSERLPDVSAKSAWAATAATPAAAPHGSPSRPSAASPGARPSAMTVAAAPSPSWQIPIAV